MAFMHPINNRQRVSFLKGLLCSLSLVCGWGVGMPTSYGAETVTIELGPFRQTVELADVENFARTGKMPPELKAFSSFLTPQVRDLLNQKLQVNPAFADKFFDEIVRTPQGKQLISSLGAVIPGSTTESLRDTLNLTLRQVNGLNVLGFLRAYPGENVTVDATKAVGLTLALNSANLQSQAFGALLERQIAVKSDTILPKNINPAAPGNEAVQQQSLVLQDRPRNRTIPVDIYSSRRNTQSSLVVISHGFGANRQYLRYLAVHLASHGITVAVLEHPGSNAVAVNRASGTADLAKLISASEFIDRPKDISFLIDELAKINTQPGQLQGKLDAENVTIIGHSLGGYTALALAGAQLDLDALRKFCNNSLGIGEAPGDWFQCAAASLKDNNIELRDKRVKSAIALNPLTGNLFGKKGLSQINIPVLMLAGTEDALTPALKHQFAPFTQLRGNKYLLTAIGGTHLSVSDPTYKASVATNIVKERRGAETSNLRSLVNGVSLAFVKQQTTEAKIYQPFLTSAYAQSLSTTQLPLRLVSELPGNLKTWAEYVAK
jgi:predicted dienelactone hydrolase